MEAYLRAFVNWKQDNSIRLLPIAKFAYNNTKNARIGHILLKLNCDYHPKFFFDEDIEFCSKFCSANELAEELEELMEVCYQNLLYAQEL